MTEAKKRPSIIAAIWVVSLGVVVIPGGILTQIWQADTRFDQRLQASPVGKLCSHCNGPAVQIATYADGTVRYYCEDHKPPSLERRGAANDTYGEKKFNPWFATLVVALFYAINTLRACVQLFQTSIVLRATLPGALFGFVFTALAWAWFASR
jgi:hypothetical protein